jgi:hypothetical protein
MRARLSTCRGGGRFWPAAIAAADQIHNHVRAYEFWTIAGGQNSFQ